MSARGRRGLTCGLLAIALLCAPTPARGHHLGGVISLVLALLRYKPMSLGP